jgi:hypothetical protein
LPPRTDDVVELTPAAELVLLAAHTVAIVVWNFMSFETFDQVADHALTMGLLPLALIVGGRFSPYMIALPLVALPICGKTLRELSYDHNEIPPAYGWLFLFALPIAVTTVAAFVFARRDQWATSGQSFSRWSLLLTSWLYFALNFAFFRFPWPWHEPTSRTPSAIVFAGCLLLLTLASVVYRSETELGRPATG